MKNYEPINNYIAACYINKQVLNTFWMFLSIFIEYILKELKFAISRIFSKFTKCLKNPYNRSRNFVLANSFCNYNPQNFVLTKSISKSCFLEFQIRKWSHRSPSFSLGLWQKVEEFIWYVWLMWILLMMYYMLYVLHKTSRKKYKL